ncbi:MAG: capsule assembly Wzi family protein [Ignavibacteria bacterium]|nr:capsule assembly Wzi family protein [Ignavibacteria bacterium]
MIKKLIFPKAFLILFIIPISLYSQQENVPIEHDVYTFLKEMCIKQIINSVHDDNPIMSRYEIKKHLENIDDHRNKLSRTELKILDKYQDEFFDKGADSSNTYQIFGTSTGFSKKVSDLFSDKMKYTYSYREENINYNLEILGRIMYGQNLKPFVMNSQLYDIGFRFRGTVLDNLGYSLTVQKGGVSGSHDYAYTIEPRLKYNFKYFERIENIDNYDFAEGYLRYYTEPVEDMKMSFQIGREKLKLGYGYGSKIVLSGDHPVLDFFKMDFNYGIFSFTSVHASTVGEFYWDREQNYTKQIAYNRFKLSFNNLFDFGFGEAIVYSGRGIDLAYLNPFVFYKFVEMSLQDRDNGVVFLDIQTRAVPNLELQATFFLDENILSHLQELDLFSNKTAYQLGAFWYSPFSIDDLSVIFEYTRIRPYVYSHTNTKNSYTSYSQSLGHRIGPNADEILLKASYNINEKMRLNAEAQFVRSGENLYDALGNVVFNAGGDYLFGHREVIDANKINFLEGERINQNIFILNFKYEPIRELWLDIVFQYSIRNNLYRDFKSYSSLAYIRLLFNL